MLCIFMILQEQPHHLGACRGQRLLLRMGSLMVTLLLMHTFDHTVYRLRLANEGRNQISGRTSSWKSLTSGCKFWRTTTYTFTKMSSLPASGTCTCWSEGPSPSGRIDLTFCHVGPQQPPGKRMGWRERRAAENKRTECKGTATHLHQFSSCLKTSAFPFAQPRERF